MSKSGGVFQFFGGRMTSHGQCPRAGADPGFLKGGGPGTDTRFFTSTPPLDIVRVTSSDLRKFEKHPHSWTFTKGGGSNFGPNVKKPTSWPKRGGSGPPGPPPLDPPLKGGVLVNVFTPPPLSGNSVSAPVIILQPCGF